MKTPMSALALPQTAAPRGSAGGREALERRRRCTAALVGAAVLFCLWTMWRMSLLLPAPAPALVHRLVEERQRRRFEAEARLGEERERERHRAARRGVGFRDDKRVVLLLTSRGDSEACARQIAAARALAFRPARLHFRLFEELRVGEQCGCVERLCELEPRDCQALLRTEQLLVQRRHASGARGPTVARHLVESMVDPEAFVAQFYLSVDASVFFTQDWDLQLLKQWYSIGNDMAILSAAPKPLELRGIATNTLMLHCSARIAAKGPDAVVSFNPPEPVPKQSSVLFAPVLQSQYSELFHFGPVSALLAVRSDPHTPHATVGHEYARASRFWTNGYDFYTPIQDSLFARYDDQPETPDPRAAAAIARSSRRIRRLLGLSTSVADEPLEDQALYSLGAARSMDQWQQYSQIDPRAPFNESTTNQFTVCDRRLHFVPFN